ncbi:MAG: anion permease [Pseudomonadota bacterium]
MPPSVLLVIAALVGLYMAWNIGANDVANAMGTSVGSKVLTLRQAVIIAGILEFAGAVLVGGYVTDTVRKGIVDPMVFVGDPQALVCGMIAALASAAIWLNLASYLGWPVSTTHSIVGAIAGFGIVVGGVQAVQWGTLLQIVLSWVTSPLVGGLVAYGVYMWIRWQILGRSDPKAEAKRMKPFLSGVLFFVLSLVLLCKGLKNLKLNLGYWQTGGLSVGFGLLGILIGRIVWNKKEEREAEGLVGMEKIFGPLQILTAASVAFAHGANDVANAVGPMAAVFATIRTGEVLQKVDVPLWILLAGGAGIVFGLATYGYRVMATIGTKITEVTPSRGFSAEFGASITILVGSKLGMPLSTTHTLVGAVIGVGFGRGIRALNMVVVRNILVSWILTIPLAAGMCVFLFYLLRWLC